MTTENGDTNEFKNKSKTPKIIDGTDDAVMRNVTLEDIITGKVVVDLPPNPFGHLRRG
jgi:hypothetical protein